MAKNALLHHKTEGFNDSLLQLPIGTWGHLSLQLESLLVLTRVNGCKKILTSFETKQSWKQT